MHLVIITKEIIIIMVKVEDIANLTKIIVIKTKNKISLKKKTLHSLKPNYALNSNLGNVKMNNVLMPMANKN